MKTIARHLIAEYYGCRRGLLDDQPAIASMLREAARAIGATILGETFHRFAPQGVSGAIVIAESHLSVHTWPEYGYVAVDIFTCGGLDPQLGFALLSDRLEASSTRFVEVLRGLPEHLPPDTDLAPGQLRVVERELSLRSR